MEPADIFEAGSLARQAVARVASVFKVEADVSIRTTKSQVSFRRNRTFAFVWRPGQWNISGPEAVLSIATPSRIESSRFREVVHPAPGTWMHHLGIADVGEIDDEVVGWLRAAADTAG